MDITHCASTIVFLTLFVSSQANRAPYFMNVWSWVIKENAPVGSRPASSFSGNEITLSGSDPEGRLLTYGVRGHTGKKFFTVDAKTGVVKIQRTFDYEVDTKYRAKFFVSDGVNEDEQEAEITVIDENDNAPIFERFPFETEVTEDHHVGAEVLVVNASDPDTGPGGIVKYYLEKVHNLPFSLDPSTGSLRLRRRLDFEDTVMYQFKVIAMDQDRAKPLTSVVPVIIRVKDVQDTSPVFQGLPYGITIPEDTPMRSRILQIHAVDGDRGTQNQNDIVYYIVKGNDDGYFMLVGGDLRIARNLNRDVEGFSGVHTLTVRAIEIGTRAFTDVTFDIMIADMNDEIPTWDQKKYTTSVREDTQPGTKLVDLGVKDLDQEENSEMTISIDSVNAPSFAVTPVICRGICEVSLILKEPLDYEDRKRIHLKIFANETRNTSHYSAVDVIINVENVNDNKPMFQQPVYSIEVPENTTIRSNILRAEAFDKDEGKFGELYYSISDSTQTFALDSDTDYIVLHKALDREKISQYIIVISASDSGSPSFRAMAAVTIHVTDVNDEMPQFDATNYAAYVTENEDIKEPIVVVRAFDGDAPPNNEINYDITGDRFSKYFRIKTTAEGTGEVFLRGPLDYELIKDGLVRLDIVATDSGEPPHNTTVPLVVTVTDVNDNRPKFTEDSTFNITVYENLDGGIRVGGIKATDRDSGRNKKIRYFVEEGRNEFDEVFRLNDFTGDITIKPGSSLDYEKKSLYDVIIVAGDHGTPPLAVKHQLLITILDMNDNSPEFTQDKYVVTSLEGMASRVAYVTATDEDSGRNGEIVYEITKGNEDGTFMMDPRTGDIVSIKPLDYESTNGVYKLIVMSTDQSEDVEDRLSSVAEVIIHVVDVNDNPPVFEISEQSMVYDVMEGIEGPRISRFVATDADSGENGFVTYSICSGNEEGFFSISHSEGNLRVHKGKHLDREENEFFNMTVCAMDSGIPALNSSLDFSIRVIDVNDNAPKFTKFHHSVRIAENTNVGSVVTSVLANDLDSEEFGNVFYSIVDGDGTFVIEKWTGVIHLAKGLDRETISEYDLEIMAKDNPRNAENSRQTTRIMKIIVSDVNDKTPRFVGKTPYRAHVDENSKPGTVVTIEGDLILALDEDIGENAIVTYTMVRDDVTFVNNYVGSQWSSFFAINGSSGEISVLVELDREVLASDAVTLVIRASDRGGRHSDVNVIVTVLDVNDNPPRFRTNKVRVGVKEDIKQGSEVTRVIATDRDIGMNGKIRYRIQSGSFDKFVINQETGILRVAPGQLLDRETKSDYTIIVVTYDKGTLTSLSSTCSVIIKLDDVNDSRPKFTALSQIISVKENTAPGTVIIQVEAIDPDLNHRLQYELVSIDVFDAHGRQLMATDDPSSFSIRNFQTDEYDVIRNWFELNETSGEINVAASNRNSIDRELCSRVQMSIRVRDLSSVDEENAEALQSASVTITIEDENDNSPTFVMSSSPSNDVIKLNDELIVNITEETAIGSIVINVKAIDPDSGNNGEVVYDIIEGDKVQMTDQKSGTILVASRIDRESLATPSGTAWVNTTVLARDLGYPESRSVKLRIAMRVEDINDNDPVFRLKRYKALIFENKTIGSEIITVDATDRDSGSFGKIIYDLKGGKNYFKIHPISGAVRLLRQLDYEETSKYKMVVTATDNQGGPEHERRETSVELVINVIDVNDCPPVFIDPRTPRTYSVQESEGVGSLVAVVTAKDPDEGAGAEITYSLLHSRFSGFFKIHSSSGHVTVKKSLTALPRNLEDPKLEVLATDGGGLTSNMTILIDIVDVNDHAPVFKEPDGKEIFIHEEEPAGSSVGYMLAEDTDSGLNGIVRYSFCDVTDDQSFFIDEVTGRIITAKRLDREKIPEYTLKVCAVDLGLPPLRSDASVTIKLLDRNDNKPEFRKSSNIENGGGAHQTIHVREDARIGQSIGHVTRATDRDSGENAHVYYHLLSVLSNDQPVDLSMFSVQTQSRQIILERLLDREKIGRYTLIIKATNDENYSRPMPIISDSPVEDTNGPPLVGGGGKDKKAAVVVKRSLENLDSLVGGGIYPAKSFKLPEEGGGLGDITDTIMGSKATASQKQDKSLPGGLIMTSESSDNMVAVMSPSAPITSQYDPSDDPSLIEVAIVIDDVNDEWPVFEKKSYVTATDVQAKPGTEVLKVLATDDDIGNNSIVTYTITNTLLRSHDNITQQSVFGVFSINKHVISTARPLEDYGEGYFKVDVEASDAGNHQARTSVYIYILQTTDRITFVVNSPPSAVKFRKNEFVAVLGNITSSRVIVDDIEYHLMPNGRRDYQRSDVTIRAFDQQTMKPMTSSELQEKLEKSKNKLEKLFGNCAVIQNETMMNDYDLTNLRIVVIVMLFFLLLIILLFSGLYCHTQRRHRRELEAFASGTLGRHKMKIASHDLLMQSGSKVYSDMGTCSSGGWKDEFYRKLGQKMVEDDESLLEEMTKVTPVPVTRGLSRSSITPQTKPRSRSENDQLREKALPRTSTDVWVPKQQDRLSQKFPVISSEALQQLLKDRSKKKKAEKKAKRESSHADSQISCETTSSSLKHHHEEEEDRRESLRYEERYRRGNSRDETLLKSDEAQLNEKKKAKKERHTERIRHGRESPELNLHSGGNSEDIVRKHSTISLHASDDITPTNMTSSSDSHMTSSMTSVKEISDV
uniref:cadherin-23-like isoform X1 n=2 Tax=Styela clava TaxID=7725 RepID=UPI00193AB292|nr:cadherin-23-like isoform X1 [Styela clava]